MMDLECFDSTNALNGFISVLMVLGGKALMNGPSSTSLNLGAALLALGFLVLALAILDRDVSSFKDARRALKGTRSMIALGSALAVVVGVLAKQYHINALLQQYDDYRVVAGLIQELPRIYDVLFYGGLIGLTVALGLNKDGSVSYTRGGLGLAAALAIYFSQTNYISALQTNDKAQVDRAANLVNASYVLLVAAVSYAC
jgi:heme A synthase